MTDQNKLTGVTAVFFGFNMAATLYFYFLQTGMISKLQLMWAALMMGMASLLVFVLMRLWLKPVFHQLTPKKILGLAVLSLMMGLLWSVSVYPRQENIFLLPTYSIQVKAQPQTNSHGSQNQVHFTWFDTAIGSASYNQFQNVQGWEREGSRFSLSQQPPASFTWHGKPGQSVTFKLARGPKMGSILLEWGDGTIETLDLFMPSETPDLTVVHAYPIPGISAFSVWTFAGLSTAFLIFLLLTAWMVWFPDQSTKKQHWLWYALPPVLTWSISLLAYWPGILTPDSISHWTQIQTGQFNDWHSVFYSVLLWALTRIIDHPSFISAVQIILLSVSIAWGLGEFQKWGIKPVYLWVIAVLQAFAFQNMITVISIWKDIPYSICLLLLTIQMMKIIRTQGRWLQVKGHIIGIGLVLCGLLLFRKNGLFVVFGSWGLWFIFYRKNWRYLLTMLLLTILIWQGFNRVVVPALDVQINSGKGVSILLHHIIAHHDAGTPISDEQEKHLDALLPLELWAYNCGVVNTVLWHPDFDRTYYEQTLDQTTQLFFDTLKKSPLVNLKHQLCASELVWRLYPTTYTFINDFDHLGEIDEYHWLSGNEYGIEEASQLPALNRAMMKYFYWSQEHTLIYILTWRPAFYLYLSLLSIALFAWKWRNRRFLLAAAPLVLQSGTLMLVNLAQDFRYQYGVVLIGILCLALWFVNPESESQD